MISYHGGPIWPEKIGARFWRGRHAMISFAYPEQLGTAASVAESFALDNGAFSEWKQAQKQPDWDEYYRWVEEWKRHPGFDFAIIPDVIDGTENQNDQLVYTFWPHGIVGVPVWHLHESLTRLSYLAEGWPRIALGSSGEWSTPGTNKWWARMAHVMDAICDDEGRPRVKLHGLRMLNPELLKHLPLASADSTTVAVNVGLDTRWHGTYSPRSKEVRAEVLAERLTPVHPAEVWKRIHIQDQLLMVATEA